MENDLIRRGDALTQFQKQYIDTQEGTDHVAIRINIGVTKCIHAMQDIPAVDAVEVKHARWIPHPDKEVRDYDCCTCRRAKIHFCSRCGFCPTYTTPYCPMCGSDMMSQRREDGLYESLKRGLEEAIAYEKGGIECRTETREDGV